MIKKIIISGLIGLMAISFVACSVKDEDSDVKSGTFSDSKVKGLSYSTTSQSGDTDAKGTFKYKDGEEVTFKIGGITLGKAKAQSDMTPMTLVGPDADINNTKVIKILQFLQSIDSDHNASNGITITDAFRESAKSDTTHFTTDEVNLESLFTKLDVKKEHQASETDAKKHFQKTLYEIKKKNTTGFAIIEGVYQDGNTILDITNTGAMKSYKYDQIDNCIKNIESGDKGYGNNGSILTHDTKKNLFSIPIDGGIAGWTYNDNNKISQVFIATKNKRNYTYKTLEAEYNNKKVSIIASKSTKFPTSADITKNMCTEIGVTKRFANIQGVYQYEDFNNSATDHASRIRNVVTHIDKDAKVKVYEYNATVGKKCLEVAKSDAYNYVLNDEKLSKGIYPVYANYVEYFYENKTDNDRVSWLEHPNGEITHVGYKAADANKTTAYNNIYYHSNFSNHTYAITMHKSKTYSEANIEDSICK
jgi:hypothetical protein